MNKISTFVLLGGLLMVLVAHGIIAQEELVLTPDSGRIVNVGKPSLGIAKAPAPQYFAYWTKPDSWVSWNFILEDGGIYEVWAEVAATAQHSGFYLNYNDRKMKIDLKGTKSYTNFKRIKFGDVELKKGKNILSLNPHRDQWEPVNIRALKLKRVEDLPCIEKKEFLPPVSTPAYILRSNEPANWEPKTEPFNGNPEEFKDHWRDAYPIGSGQLGGMVYGGVEEERIMLQDARHWWNHGGPSPRHFPDVSSQLSRVRALQNQEKYDEANTIYREAIGNAKYGALVGSPLPIGDLVLKSKVKKYTDYSRSLDLERSEATTKWTANGVHFSRKAFISRAANTKDILFVEVEADKKSALNFEVHLGLHNPKKAKGCNPKSFSPNVNVDFAGNVQYVAHNPHTPSALKDFGAVARIISHDGELEKRPDHVKLRNATSALIAVKTFNSAGCKNAVDRLTRELYKLKGDYQDFIKPHLEIHQGLFNSASLDLNASEKERARTNEELLADVHDLKLSKALTERMWAMGRYLSVVGSRKGGLPVHLTGLWNGNYHPTWAIHLMNINMPMIHWHLMDGNVSELMLPFFDMFDKHLPASKVLAQKLYGARGIYINPLFGNNEGGLLKIISPHLIHLIGSDAWVAQHYWDYYSFTLDKKFLAERAVPFMEESALFYEDFLVENKDGLYDISPSNSPENSPRDAKGESLVPYYHLDTHKNSTWEYAAIREMLNHLIEASEILKINEKQILKWKKMIAKLRPYEINSEGGIREWLADGWYDNPAHRHLTHLYPIMPGYEINKEDTAPKLFNAFVQTSRNRLQAGLKYQSAWSLMHHANVRARVGDAKTAYQCLKWVATSSVLPNLFTTHSDWRGIGYPMLGPPIFQIDANMGWVSAVQEMLFTSRMGVLKIIPALPVEWPDGKIQGMRARGDVNIEYMSWQQNGQIVHAQISSNHSQQLKVILPKAIKTLKINGKKHKFNKNEFLLKLTAGKKYEIEIETK